MRNLRDEKGKLFYAIYAIRADVAEFFVQKAAEGNFQVEKYGVILEAFPGEPSAEILEMVKENFGESAVL